MLFLHLRNRIAYRSDKNSSSSPIWAHYDFSCSKTHRIIDIHTSQMDSFSLQLATWQLRQPWDDIGSDQHFSATSSRVQFMTPHQPGEYLQWDPPFGESRWWVCSKHGMVAEFSQKWCGIAKEPAMGPKEACSLEKNEQIGSSTHWWICKACFDGALGFEKVRCIHPTVRKCTQCGIPRGPGVDNNALEHKLCIKRLENASCGPIWDCLTLNLVNARICVGCRSMLPDTPNRREWHRDVSICNKVVYCAKWWCCICGSDLPAPGSLCQNVKCNLLMSGALTTMPASFVRPPFIIRNSGLGHGFLNEGAGTFTALGGPLSAQSEVSEIFLQKAKATVGGYNGWRADWRLDGPPSRFTDRSPSEVISPMNTCQPVVEEGKVSPFELAQLLKYI